MTSKADKRRALAAQIARAQAELDALSVPEYVEPRLPGTILAWSRTFAGGAREYTYAAVLRSDRLWQATHKADPLTWDELVTEWGEVSEHRWVQRPHKASGFTPLAER